jgi:hypothetical protein
MKGNIYVSRQVGGFETQHNLIHFSLTLDSQGWTFTNSFPRNYTAAKECITCMRRKKGVCHRQFISQLWTTLHLITLEDNRELFTDIATGELNLFGAEFLYLILYRYECYGF